MIYLSLFLNFLKIGLFTFGGAYGAIPLIREAVLSNGWLTEEQFSYFLAVSESTPGPIMVNMATYVGFEEAGVLGSALCTLGVVLPSYVIIVLITSVLRRIIDHPRVRAVLSAIVPCVTGIVLTTGIYMTYEALTATSASESTPVDLAAVASAVLLVVAMAVYKAIRKKPLSPILLIVTAAVLGMLFYGLL
jgi:chromate transporter